MRVLSKSRNKREDHELEAAAMYLQENINYFHKFSVPQLVEICRISESITLYNNSLLYREGLTGQGFYAILSGGVEIWKDEATAGKLNRLMTYNTLSKLRNQEDLYNGLGIKCDKIGPGSYFGDKVLTEKKFVGSNSYVTIDDHCEILVIYKEDYKSLYQIIMNTESMERLSLLRKTDVFRSADVIYLNTLGKAMEQRVYKMDEVVYKAGDHAEEIIIIKAGECKVLTNVKEDSDKKNRTKIDDGNICINTVSSCTSIDSIRVTSPIIENATSSLPLIHQSSPNKTSRKSNLIETKSIEIGRIAPNSVLSLNMALYEDYLLSETVVASTIVVAFIISKHNYIHIPKQYRTVIRKIIEDFRAPSLDKLWEIAPRIIDEDKWRKEKSWEMFKDDIRNKKKDSNILMNFKNLDGMTFEPVDYTLQNSHMQNYSTTIYNNHNVVYETWGLKQVHSRNLQLKVKTTGKKKKAEPKTKLESEGISRNIRDKMIKLKSDIDSTESIVDSHFNTLDTLSYISTDLKIPTDTSNQILNYPFSLIHIHKESLKDKANPGLFTSHKNVNCYFRVCCIGQDINNIKFFLDKYAENVYLTIYKGDAGKERELLFKWKPYSSYDKMVLSDSDQFLIYCRNTPVEYASLDESSENLFIAPFPSICKDSEQKFACIVVNPTRSFDDNKNKHIEEVVDSESDSDSEDNVNIKNRKGTSKRKKRNIKKKDVEEQIIEKKKESPTCKLSMYLLEFTVVNEVIGTFSSRISALRYAIDRFGFVPAAFQDRLLSDETFSNNSINKKISTGEDSNKILLKDLKDDSPQAHDRIFLQIHNEEKKICVVPLYEWILINESNIDKFNFLNGFSLPEDDEVIDIPTSSDSPGKVRIVKSFSEVGLANNKRNVKRHNDYVKRFSVVMEEPKNTMIPNASNKLVTSKSIQILENETQLKEFSKCVDVLSKSNKTFPSASRPSTSSIDEFLFVDEGFNKSNQQKNGELLEVRLQNLNDTLSDRRKLIDKNDKLCDIEHDSYKNYRYNSRLSAVAAHMGGPPPIFKNNDADPRMRFINKTLEIVESLQSLTVNKFEERTPQKSISRSPSNVSTTMELSSPLKKASDPKPSGNTGSMKDKLHILNATLRDKT